MIYLLVVIVFSLLPVPWWSESDVWIIATKKSSLSLWFICSPLFIFGAVIYVLTIVYCLSKTSHDLCARHCLFFGDIMQNFCCWLSHQGTSIYPGPLLGGAGGKSIISKVFFYLYIHIDILSGLYFRWWRKYQKSISLETLAPHWGLKFWMCSCIYISPPLSSIFCSVIKDIRSKLPKRNHVVGVARLGRIQWWVDSTQIVWRWLES